MKKSFFAIVLASVLVFAFAASAIGTGLQNVVMTSGAINSIQADFLGGNKGSGAYGTDKTRIITQCYVRLQEGNVDTGRCYSSKVSTTYYNRVYSPKKSKVNDPFHTCYLNYGWIY